MLDTYEDIVILDVSYYNIGLDDFKIRIPTDSYLKEHLLLKRYLRENDRIIVHIISDVYTHQAYKYFLLKYDEYTIKNEKDSIVYEFYITCDEDITRQVKIDKILKC
jgi:hypothetical protein